MRDDDITRPSFAPAIADHVEHAQGPVRIQTRAQAPSSTTKGPSLFHKYLIYKSYQRHLDELALID
jgi:hypothetical protein